MNNDEIIFDEYEQMMGDALIDYEEKLRAHGEGFEEGEQVGIEKKTTEIIKSMLENKFDYEMISKITNKSIEEIKEIENNLN